MPKSKEYVSTDDSDEDVKPTKRQKLDVGIKEEKAAEKPNKESDVDQESTWDLGSNRQVSVREFKGKLYVDIREMYYDKDANLKPGKKGICLNMAQWRRLLSVMDDVDKAVKSKS